MKPQSELRGKRYSLYNAFILINAGYCEQLGLKVCPIKQLLDIKGSTGVQIPYLGCVEDNLQIYEFTKCNEDVLILVEPNTLYGKHVPLK